MLLSTDLGSVTDSVKKDRRHYIQWTAPLSLFKQANLIYFMCFLHLYPNLLPSLIIYTLFTLWILFKLDGKMSVTLKRSFKWGLYHITWDGVECVVKGPLLGEVLGGLGCCLWLHPQDSLSTTPSCFSRNVYKASIRHWLLLYSDWWVTSHPVVGGRPVWNEYGKGFPPNLTHPWNLFHVSIWKRAHFN